MKGSLVLIALLLAIGIASPGLMAKPGKEKGGAAKQQKQKQGQPANKQAGSGKKHGEAGKRHGQPAKKDAGPGKKRPNEKVGKGGKQAGSVKKGDKRPHPMRASDCAAVQQRLREVSEMHRVKKRGTCRCDLCRLAEKYGQISPEEFAEVVPIETLPPELLDVVAPPEKGKRKGKREHGKKSKKQRGYKQKGNNGLGNGIDPQPPGNPPVNDGSGVPGQPGNRAKGGKHRR